MMDTEEAQSLIDFIAKSPTAFHATQNIATMLDEAGYTELRLKERWNIAFGGHYYVRQNGTSIIAFNVPSALPECGYRMIAAHSDSPTFRIKPHAERKAAGGMTILNTEPYGGSLLYTWIDRPLGLAGRVMLKSTETLTPETRLFDTERPIGVIPSVAIHMNRDVNDNLQLNKQTDMQILVETGDSQTSIRQMIADKLDVTEAEILDYDLYAYDTTPGCLVGLDDSLIVCPRQDNLTMAYTATRALLDTDEEDTIGRMLLIFDNEEVGSGTKQGAASPLAKDILRRVSEAIAKSNDTPQEETFQIVTYNSFLVSADMAHAVHPNHESLHDPVLHPKLGGGPVIKYNAAQKYMTDADGAAVFMQICHEADVPFQEYANRSDMAGGSTLGNILTSQLALRGVDVGAAMLGMHSSRETGGTADVNMFRKAFGAFYRAN